MKYTASGAREGKFKPKKQNKEHLGKHQAPWTQPSFSLPALGPFQQTTKACCCCIHLYLSSMSSFSSSSCSIPTSLLL